MTASCHRWGVCFPLLALVFFAEVGRAQDKPWNDYSLEAKQLREAGRYPEAEKAYLAALRQAEAIGKPDPQLAVTLNGLALLYQTQGRYAEAEPRYRRAADLFEELYGPKDLTLATTLHNLAELCRQEGKYLEAERLCRRALAIRRDLLGEEHPDVAMSLNTLSGVYASEGQYA
ncbi:MAG: tetratricopeptide repeat protein, partial [Acidobacteria bacterium]|nr:tetratricopeptide repeat protein [Acidobacteriota bacterium]